MDKITLIGSAVLDIILVSKEKNISLGQKIEVDDFHFSLGGGALNASLTFKKLGLKPHLFCHLGKDFLGEIIEQQIKKLNLDYEVFRHKRSTSFSIVFLPSSGERVIFVFRGPESNFTFEELKKVKITPFIYITPGSSKAEDFRKFFEKIKNSTKLIALNPSKIFLQDKKAPLALKLVDIIFVNEEEARIFINDFKNPIEIVGKKIKEKLNPQILVITLGDKGSLTFWNNRLFSAGIFKVKKVVDKTGAGDAFNSAFLGWLILKKEINEENLRLAIKFASANASSVIQKLGAQNGLLSKKDYFRFKNLKITSYTL